jgi:hypothetical protein
VALLYDETEVMHFSSDLGNLLSLKLKYICECELRRRAVMNAVVNPRVPQKWEILTSSANFRFAMIVLSGVNLLLRLDAGFHMLLFFDFEDVTALAALIKRKNWIWVYRVLPSSLV